VHRLLVGEPKPQRLPQGFRSRQSSLLAERIQLGAFKIGEVNDGPHDVPLSDDVIIGASP
jgi:hypothetical protein